MATIQNSLCSATSVRYLRVNNVVKRLGKNERTIRHWAQTGQIPAVKIDKKSWGFRPEDVERVKREAEADDDSEQG